MKAVHLSEPELEFGTGPHVDIRFGIMEHGPLDVDRTELRSLRLGVVGTAETVEHLTTWLGKCSSPIEAKKSAQPQLFVRFPGFTSNRTFRSTLDVASRNCRTIPQKEFERLADKASPDALVAGSVELFIRELEVLAESPAVQVVVCAPPMEILRAMLRGYKTEDEEPADGLDFRRLLKARGMQALPVPIQIVLPTTYRPQYRKELPVRLRGAIRLQDEATRAWNLFTALYYKAGGTPWRIQTAVDDYSVCYVGVSFFEGGDEQLHTSVAQVFSQRGDGLIIRGGLAKVSKEDRQPHLDREGAYGLLSLALDRYRQEHGTDPARLVLHKSSRFLPSEADGFEAACEDHRIDDISLMWIRRSNTRLFRAGRYPPLRGTFLRTPTRNILYTRGSVDFYSTYPGQYVPRPLSIEIFRSDHSPEFLAREVLALTKMNWNDTQFDNRDPITLKASRKVGEILPYLSTSDHLPARYSFYM